MAGTNGTVPVTLITGFLGSGKTTLVKYILTAKHGYKIAVILNEFGESQDVERPFIQDIEGKQSTVNEWVELANGCLCCSVKDNFVQALEGLTERKEQMDYILVETTGLANPGPVASVLWTDKGLESAIQLDCIVTVADALNISRQLEEPRAVNSVNEAQLQVAYADILILNKMDLVDEEAVLRAEADIRAVNSTVRIIRTKKCQIDLKYILNTNKYNEKGLNHGLPPIAEDENDNNRPDLESSHSHGANPSASMRSCPSCTGPLEPLSHDRGITSVTLQVHKALQLEKVRDWLDSLLWDRHPDGEDVFRMKGILNIEGSDAKHSLQVVYALYEIEEGPLWKAEETRLSKVVVIGRRLHQDLLQQALLSCSV